MKKNLSLLLVFLSVLSSVFSQEKNAYAIYKTENPIIYDICFSSNGNALCIADNNSIKVYSTESRELINEFKNGHTGQIMTIDISKDSSLLVSGGKDSTIVVWDFAANRILHSLHYQKVIITAVKISPDNRYLISGGSDSKVYLYDLKRNEPIHEFSEHTKDITSLAFSPDGCLFASASGDHLISIYDIESKTLVASLSGHKNWVRSISFSPDGTKLISCGDDSKVIKWEISDLNNIIIAQLSREGFDWFLSVDFNEDSRTYVTGGIDGKIRIVANFENYSARIGKPINKVIFKPNEGYFLKVAVATRGSGVIFMEANDMELK